MDGSKVRKSALGKVYELAWGHESPNVRLAALGIVTRGRVDVEDTVADSTADNVELWEALKGAGCSFKHGMLSQGWWTVTCDGARECYGDEALYERVEPKRTRDETVRLLKWYSHAFERDGIRSDDEVERARCLGRAEAYELAAFELEMVME